MKIKNGEISNSIDVINKLGETRFPSAAVSITVLRNTKKLGKEHELIEETRQKLFKEYCKTDKEGNLIIENNCVIPEDKVGLNKAWGELSEAEVEIDLTPIAVESLDAANLTPVELNKILFMIEGENDAWIKE